jgi:hypothetical protein
MLGDINNVWMRCDVGWESVAESDCMMRGTSLLPAGTTASVAYGTANASDMPPNCVMNESGPWVKWN